MYHTSREELLSSMAAYGPKEQCGLFVGFRDHIQFDHEGRCNHGPDRVHIRDAEKTNQIYRRKWHVRQILEITIKQSFAYSESQA